MEGKWQREADARGHEEHNERVPLSSRAVLTSHNLPEDWRRRGETKRRGAAATDFVNQSSGSEEKHAGVFSPPSFLPREWTEKKEPEEEEEEEA